MSAIGVLLAAMIASTPAFTTTVYAQMLGEQQLSAFEQELGVVPPPLPPCHPCA
jgi:hypothetical protein